MLTRRLIMPIALIAVAMVSAVACADSLLREERTVIVNGIAETWQLRWAKPPSSYCGPESVLKAISCPCRGFAYGETGTLLLVRLRGNTEVERLNLSPLYQEWNDRNQSFLGADGDGAALPHWPMNDSDFDRESNGDKTLLAEIKNRPPTQIMQLADYDHDGQATEFLIPVAAPTCEDGTYYVAVGVSKDNPHLHGLAPADDPKDPFVIRR